MLIIIITMKPRQIITKENEMNRKCPECGGDCTVCPDTGWNWFEMLDFWRGLWERITI